MKLSMRKAAVAAVLMVLAAQPAAADIAAANAAYAQLLTKYVTPRGVRYTAWRGTGGDLKAISSVVAAYRSADNATLPPEERKALYINLYNAKIIETVLQGNPKASIKELSKGINPFEIFSRKMTLLNGKGVSQNDIEKMVRDEFKDPRVHFALNCASRSCPPIRVEPYVTETLDAQLDNATRSYLALPGAVVVKTSGGKSTITSVKIFDWYADDFKASGGALAFVGKYGPQAAADAIAAGKAKLDYADYDWSLNSTP